MSQLSKAERLGAQNSTNVRSLPSKAERRIALLKAAFRVSGALAPGLGARLAERIFLSPKRYAIPQAEAAFLATGHRSEIDSYGRRISVWTWGDGPTVILLHGWEGRAGQMIPFVQPLLDAGFSVIAYDAPAHGGSEGRVTSMVDFTRTLRAVAEWAGPVHAVIGHSLGGSAATLALLQGLRARRVVLLGSPANPGNYSRQFVDLLGVPPKVFALMRRRVEQRYKAFWEDLDLLRRVPSLSVPALLFHDRNDSDVPWRDALTLSNAWPGAELVTTERLGHRRILRDPAVIQKTVEFLKEEKR
jgi:pimeloyl-ACP methyl ester carboxylesterase